MNREDFLILKNNLIYFDSGATTLKPSVLSIATSDYYNNYSANAHRGDYDLSLRVDNEYENTRVLIKNFINASSTNEIVFTSGCTDSLNKIVFGYFKNVLKKDDEILLTKSEHASNLLPWFELAKELDLKINYIELNDNYEVTIDNLKKAITSKTKVISIAGITNVIGDERPIKEITDLAHNLNILVVIDGAQYVPHKKTDVQELDIDFLAFSAHKMYGPTGVGILYGKEELLKNTKPIIFGGGMNSVFTSDMEVTYSSLPTVLEAGTPNIAGVIGFGKVIEYLNNIGIDKISEHELNVRNYCLNELKKLDNIIIYNEYSKGSTIAFNIKDIFAQDSAIYLNKYNICVRAGNHCAKILKDELGIKNTVRISFGMYNTKEEVDTLIKVLSNSNIKNEII